MFRVCTGPIWEQNSRSWLAIHGFCRRCESRTITRGTMKIMSLWALARISDRGFRISELAKLLIQNSGVQESEYRTPDAQTPTRR
jgi:hypothetical protein